MSTQVGRALTQDAGEPRLVLHLGAPKCGSSSVQAALSRRPDFMSRTGRPISYLVATANAAITGARIRTIAEMSDFGYASSSALQGEAGPRVLSSLERGVAAVQARGRLPVLSSEGWLTRSQAFLDSGVLKRLGGGTHVVISVRPPLDWMNAAWWQWGVWSDGGLDRFLAACVPQARWGMLARRWAAVPGVEAVHLRLADRDAVGALFDVLDAAPPDAASINTSLPSGLLALLTRNRDLRPGPHESAIEFRLARALASAPPPPDGPSLWALDSARQEEAWTRLRFHPRQIGPLLPDEDRARLRRDRRWFGPEGYADRPVVMPRDLETPEALTALHDWLAAAAGQKPAAAPLPDVTTADSAIRPILGRLTQDRAAVLSRLWRLSRLARKS